ncbi:MAG: hypothetical protein O3A00_12380 [Planctomycetota bacterium]|nr:hypothetical protein [Planctomycetota bacterium]
MKNRRSVIAVTCLSIVVSMSQFARAEDKVKNADKVEKTSKKEAAEKTVEVDLKGLKLNVPVSWKKEEPKSKLRLGQFALPGVKGEKHAVELTVFNFGGGGQVEANIQRWVGQFLEDDRKVKMSRGKAGEIPYFFVELSGTYKKPDGPPFQQKTINVPDSRMLAVILPVADRGVFFLKMTGGDKSVSAQAAAFRKSFGGDASGEKALELK